MLQPCDMDPKPQFTNTYLIQLLPEENIGFEIARIQHVNHQQRMIIHQLHSKVSADLKQWIGKTNSKSNPDRII